jgi:hypothetical protein
LAHDELYRLLGIEFPEGMMVHINKQIVALVDILELMKKNGITEVSAVQLTKPDAFYRIELPGGDTPALSRLAQGGITVVSATPTPAPTPVSATPVGATSTPATVGAPEVKNYAESFLIGNATPIKVIFTGSNLNSSKLLYELSFGRNIYNIDELIFQAKPNGNVQVTVTIIVPTFIGDVSF